MPRPQRTPVIARPAAWAITVMLPLLACLGAAAAQEVRATGAAAAEVPLDVTVQFAPSLELRLTAGLIGFDLRSLGEEGAPACVLGEGSDRVVATDRDGVDRIAPAGTTFEVAAWPAVEVSGGQPIAAYPPPSDATAGGLVCYATFELQTFANVPGWQLAVARTDRDAFPPLYLASVCAGDPGGGLIALPDGERRTLESGRESDGCRSMLIVLAVRVDGATAGTQLTDMQYTLLAADADFGVD